MDKSKGKYAGLVYIIILTLFVGVRILFSSGVLRNVDPAFLDVLSSIFIQVILLLLLGTGLYMMFNKRSLKKTTSDFKFKKIKGSTVLSFILMGVIVFILNILVATFFNAILAIFGYSAPTGSGGGLEYTSVATFLLGVFITAVLPGFCEEVLHRGMLLNSLKSKVGVRNALIISSLLFGLMHMNVSQFFYATILGVLMGYTVLLTGSIWPAVILHFMNNFLNVYISYASNQGLLFGNFYDILNVIFTGNFYTSIISLAIIIGLLVFALIKLLEREKNEINRDKIINTMQVIEAVKDDGDQVFESGEMDEVLSNAFEIDDKTGKVNYIHQDLKELNVRKKIYIRDNILIFGSLFLGGLVTLFTYLWGVI